MRPPQSVSAVVNRAVSAAAEPKGWRASKWGRDHLTPWSAAAARRQRLQEWLRQPAPRPRSAAQSVAAAAGPSAQATRERFGAAVQDLSRAPSGAAGPARPAGWR